MAFIAFVAGTGAAAVLAACIAFMAFMAFGMVKKEENELAKRLRSDKLHEKMAKRNKYFYQNLRT